MKQVTVDGEKVWVYENRVCRSCGDEGPEKRFHGNTCHVCSDAEILDDIGGFHP